MQARSAIGASRVHLIRPAGRFLVPFVEMCAAMCVGGLLLNLFFFGTAALVGRPDFAQTYVALSMLVIGVDWALAMLVWMAARGHTFRHSLEMAGTAVVVAAAFAFAETAGWLQPDLGYGWISLFTLMCGPACALMAIDMLAHARRYSARTHAH